MRLLLIDDDADCLDGLTTVLEPAGYACSAFTAPEEVVEDFRQKQYDVVITDMKMPGMNGIQVLKTILSLSPNTRVIIVTGFGDAETAVAAVNNRAYAFFGKPIDISDLINTLERIEGEIREREKVRKDHARLALEYARLKRAYEELLKLLGGR